MRNNLSYEQLDELIRFADDDRHPVDLAAVETLASLNAAVQRNIVRHLSGQRKRNAMLNERLQRYTERQEREVIDGNSREYGIDSADVANIIMYHLQHLKTYKLSVYKVNAILYEMYAGWLFRNKERMVDEHPVATAYGPRFWRALKNCYKENHTISYEEYRSIASRITEKKIGPGILSYAENAAKRYYDVSDKDLNEMFMKSKAFKNATPEYNNGKWNKEIADGDIFEWKKSQASKDAK